MIKDILHISHIVPIPHWLFQKPVRVAVSIQLEIKLRMLHTIPSSSETRTFLSSPSPEEYKVVFNDIVLMLFYATGFCTKRALCHDGITDRCVVAIEFMN